MITKLKATWTRHDYWAPRWGSIIWKILVIVMMVIIPVDLYNAMQDFISGNIVAGIVDLAFAVWFIFILFVQT